MTRLGIEQDYEVKDGFRTICFKGWFLGEADSTITGNEPRWTELSLYKTTTGHYVLQKVGRSDVFHNETCAEKSGKAIRGKRWGHLDLAADAQDVPESEDLENVFIPCEICNPEFDDEPVWVEKDLFSTTSNLTAKQVLEALYRPDTRNTKGPGYLSRVARELLDQACERDDELARVVSEPVNVT
jgi:hypothetical protein